MIIAQSDQVERFHQGNTFQITIDSPSYYVGQE